MIFKQLESSINDVDIERLSNEVNLSFITTSVLANRGFDTKEKINEFLSPNINQLHDPFLLKDMREVVDKINNAVKNNKRILIFGDYDVDGISATAILYKYFESKHIKADYFLPNRYENGYGLTIDTAKQIIEEYKPELIITVDCGISCHDEVEYIKSQGIDIIVTDHHELPEKLPECLIVNAKQPNQKYPFRELCGAGVALKLVQALGEKLDNYLPICAIATVADIVDLLDENRAIVCCGLKNKNRLPKGIKRLLDELGLNNFDSRDIAFKVAPKLNASGRMGDASISLKLYITDNDAEIDENLAKLNEMNQRRQDLCNVIYEDCFEKLKNYNLNYTRSIILYSDKWDSGLLGIVCARLTEEFNKPVFLFSEDEGYLRGSVRSINGINIHEVLSGASTLLETFGGHSMAAGLTLKKENFDKFKKEIEDYLFKNYVKDDFVQIKDYDFKLKEQDISLNLVKELDKLEPFGCGNPKPIFYSRLHDVSANRMKNYPQHINLTTKTGLSLLAFNNGQYLNNIYSSSCVDVIYELQLNEFRGKTFIKGLIKNFKFLGYKDSTENYIKGNYLNQLVYKKSETKNPFCNYESLDYTISKLSSKSLYGTLIVCSSLESIKRISLHLTKFNYEYCIGKVKQHNTNNAVVLGLNDFEGIEKYSNIIFTEPLLNMDYLYNFSGNLYLPKNHNVNLKSLNLDLSHDCFSNIYKKLFACNGKIEAENRYDFYEKFIKINPELKNLSYAQFNICLLTFIDLKFINENVNENYSITFNENIEKTELDNSVVYKRIKKLI